MSSIVTPIITLVLGFLSGLYQSKRKEWNDRRNYSKLGVSIIDTLLEEIDTGIGILEGRAKAGAKMPAESWQGMDTIPNEVMLRIIAVDRGEKPPSDEFAISTIKIHCKNYFVNVCCNINNGNIGRSYLDDTKKVKRMLVKAREQLDDNSRQRWPK